MFTVAVVVDSDNTILRALDRRRCGNNPEGDALGWSEKAAKDKSG